ncbi:MAG: hypothetical protein FK734_07055 [Asgard group archaeon]|nr:hypothetical protein [Asgard group archaeon]
MSKILNAAITEGIVLVVVTFVVIMLYVRYFTRKKSTALALAVAFNFWDFAIICLFVNRVLAYLQEIGQMPDTFGYSELGINLGYGFSALSNVFILVFVALVFSQSSMFRQTGMFIPLIFAAFNGVTVGLIIGKTASTLPFPTYELIPTIYHLLMTLISFSALIIFTIKPLRFASYKWERAGFIFIILSGVFGILIYVSFALDLIFGEDFLNLFNGGYTPFFFLAYVFAILMCSLAYLGFVMPKFVRNWFKEDDIKTV